MLKLKLSKIPPHKITFGTQEKTIAGYKCKNATVKVLHKTKPYTIEVWYTDEIKVSNPNWCTPYKEIKGMLMEYQVEKLDVVMKFTATKVEMTEFTPEEFTLPEGYKKISYQEMEESLQQLKEI